MEGGGECAGDFTAGSINATDLCGENMKINGIMLVIALAIAALAGYGFFSANDGEPYQMILAIGAGVVLFITLGGTIAIKSATGRGSVANIRVLSALFLVLFVVEQVIFSFVLFRISPYIIVTGIMLLVYILIAYAVEKALGYEK
jgi:hypothetical protein